MPDFVRKPLALKGFSDLASAMACRFTGQTESKTLVLGCVKILFQHRWFVTMVWKSTHIH
jgi:hypothetical protein